MENALIGTSNTPQRSVQREREQVEALWFVYVEYQLRGGFNIAGGAVTAIKVDSGNQTGWNRGLQVNSSLLCRLCVIGSLCQEGEKEK